MARQLQHLPHAPGLALLDLVIFHTAFGGVLNIMIGKTPRLDPNDFTLLVPT